MSKIIYILIPIAMIIFFWGYLFLRIYSSLKTMSLKKGLKIALSILISGIITLPISGLWTAIDAYSVCVIYFCGFVILFDAISFIVHLFYKKRHLIWIILHRVMLIPLLCTMIMGIYGFCNVKQIVCKEYVVTTDKKIQKEGYKIALMSDIHYGVLNNKDSLIEIVNNLSEENLDLFLLCGDIVDENTTYSEMEEIFSILGKVQSRYGSYFVYGNHDKTPNNQHPVFTDEQLWDTLMKNGITRLSDQTVEVGEDILLVGRQDRSTTRMSIAELMAGKDRSRYAIVLDHQPYEFKEKVEQGVDLALSGHTHAGQLFPVGTLMKILHACDLTYGIKKVSNMQAITTSGISGSHPIRTQGKSEYVIIQVTSSGQ